MPIRVEMCESFINAAAFIEQNSTFMYQNKGNLRLL